MSDYTAPGTGDHGEPQSRPVPASRPKKTPEDVLRNALLGVAGLTGVVGLLMMLTPTFLWDTIGGAAEQYDRAYASTRFAGGLLVGLAVGSLLVLRSPSGQSTLVTTMAIQATLAAVAVAYGIFVDDTPTDLWFELLTELLVSALAGYLWFARFKARGLLKGAKPKGA